VGHEDFSRAVGHARGHREPPYRTVSKAARSKCLAPRIGVIRVIIVGTAVALDALSRPGLADVCRLNFGIVIPCRFDRRARNMNGKIQDVKNRRRVLHAAFFRWAARIDVVDNPPVYWRAHHKRPLGGRVPELV